jgi:hypothetical protein
MIGGGEDPTLSGQESGPADGRSLPLHVNQEEHGMLDHLSTIRESDTPPAHAIGEGLGRKVRLDGGDKWRDHLT